MPMENLPKKRKRAGVAIYVSEKKTEFNSKTVI